MTSFRRPLAALSILLATVLALPTPAVADDAPGGDANAALAQNTTDGSTVVRTAFSIRKVNDGVVDQSNEAYALASCTACRTVAVAMQVVLVRGSAHYVKPVNRAGALNDKCSTCLTYASATQVVLGVDGPVRFTSDGRRRLAALATALRNLEQQVPTMGAAQLHAAVSAMKAELVSILATQLVVKTNDQDRTETEDPFTTVAPAGTDSPNPAAQSSESTPASSTATVSGPAGRGEAVTTTSSSAGG